MTKTPFQISIIRRIIYTDVIQWRQNWPHSWYDAHPTSIQLRRVQQSAGYRKERAKKQTVRQKSKRW